MIKWLLEKIGWRRQRTELHQLEKQQNKYLCFTQFIKNADPRVGLFYKEVLPEMLAEILEQFPAIDHNDPNFAIKMAKLQGEFDALYNGLLLEIENSDQLLKNTERELDIFKKRHQELQTEVAR